MRVAHERSTNEFFAFAVVKQGGTGPMKDHLLFGFMTEVLSAFLLTGLLLRLRLAGYWDRVKFVLLFALAAAVIAHLPNWNWWGFPLDYTLVGMADILIGYFLAGLVLAKITNIR